MDNFEKEELNNNEEINIEIIPHYEERKKRSGGFNLFITLLLAAFVGFSAGIFLERADTSNGILQSRKMEKLQKLIDENYYFSDKINHERAAENAYSAYVGSFGDRFTYYLSESEFNSMMESTTGNYVGIGIEVTVNEDNYITVINSFKGGPAYESGIEPGDQIREVEGTAYSGDELDAAIAILKGHENEKVNIKIFDVSENELKDVTVTRRAVVIETVDSRMLENNIGYIKISSFGDTTFKEFENHFKIIKEQNAESLIIDLRNNSGGTLDSVVKVADLLMPEGEVVRVKYKSFADEVYPSDASSFEGKIAVLINERTASAAELLAGGLRDLNQAVLVGKNSFGKSVVGTLFPVDSKTATVITTGEYFLPGGDSIHGTGLMPQAEVDLPETVKNIYLLEDKDDTQLKRAIEELK